MKYQISVVCFAVNCKNMRGRRGKFAAQNLLQLFNVYPEITPHLKEAQMVQLQGVQIHNAKVVQEIQIEDQLELFNNNSPLNMLGYMLPFILKPQRSLEWIMRCLMGKVQRKNGLLDLSSICLVITLSTTALINLLIECIKFSLNVISSSSTLFCVVVESPTQQAM